jgi:deoxyadenosine/deoxycytidine kinase
MIISIEGNIGSGKSTIIEYLRLMNEHSLQNKNIIFVDEPVNEWKNIKSNNKNALELFYEDQDKNAFWFQVLAYITRLRNLLKTIEENPDKIIITERSIYTDKFVFAQMLYESGKISDIEFKTYKYWFDTFEDKTKIDIILYVNTEPEECLNRIKVRNRTEESSVKLEYLQKCHQKHLEWFKQQNNCKIICINGHQNKDQIRSDVIKILNNSC